MLINDSSGEKNLTFKSYQDTLIFMLRSSFKLNNNQWKLSRKQVGTAWVNLVIFFFAFTSVFGGGLFCIPNLTLHKTNLSFKHGKWHLKLQHTQDPEKHNHAVNYQKNEDDAHDHHPEHEYHLADSERCTLIATNSPGFSKATRLPHYSSDFIKIVYDQDPQLLPQPPPLLTRLASISTTVLLI